MTESEALEKLKLEGGLEIGGKPKRVAEFFEALSIAIKALEESIVIKADGFSNHLLNMGYRRGITEFAEKLKHRCDILNEYAGMNYVVRSDIDEIATELKGE